MDTLNLVDEPLAFLPAARDPARQGSARRDDGIAEVVLPATDRSAPSTGPDRGPWCLRPARTGGRASYWRDTAAPGHAAGRAARCRPGLRARRIGGSMQALSQRVARDRRDSAGPNRRRGPGAASGPRPRRRTRSSRGSRAHSGRRRLRRRQDAASSVRTVHPGTPPTRCARRSRGRWRSRCVVLADGTVDRARVIKSLDQVIRPGSSRPSPRPGNAPSSRRLSTARRSRWPCKFDPRSSASTDQPSPRTRAARPRTLAARTRNPRTRTRRTRTQIDR